MAAPAAAPAHNSYFAVGIATREKEKGHSAAVAMAFARSAKDFQLLPKHRERLLELSSLHNPQMIDECSGYFKSVKLRTREGSVQGNMHVCSCAYPGATARSPSPVTPKVIQQRPESEEELVLPTASERAQLFDIMDGSGDGRITEREFVNAVAVQWPQFHNEPALKVAMRAADTSNDGRIGRQEFRQLLEYLVFFNNLWSKFSALDTEGDGVLDLEEFKRGSKLVGNKLTTADAEAEFAAIDVNGTGQISFPEFASWSAHRQSQGIGDDQEVAVVLNCAGSAESSGSHEDKPNPSRTPVPPPRAASGRRVRVPELATGRMIRLPQKVQANEIVRPTHFTVWVITKSSNTAKIYPHLRNLAYLFMRDSTDLNPFLRLHRDWLAGDLAVYDPTVAIASPAENATEVLIPVMVEKTNTPFNSLQLVSTSSRPDHSLASPRYAQTPRGLPGSDSKSMAHTPRGQDATKANQMGGIQMTDERMRTTENDQATKEEAAAVLLQARVRGMLARTAQVKVQSGVAGFKKDSYEVQLARERRHLWQTRREIAVIDWPQELRRAAIAADLKALRVALKHLSTDAAGGNVNAATEAGMTALHYACCSGKDEIVLELLEAGADPRLHTRRAWSNHTHGAGVINMDGVDKTGASRSIQHAAARVEKTPGDYAGQNKMFTMQKLCEQRAYDMHREDGRMAMLRKKKEIEMRFGAPRSTRRGKYKEFHLKDTAELHGSHSPSGLRRAQRRVLVDAQGQHVALPQALTVPERHSLSLQKHVAHQRVARQLKRPNRYPQFGMKEATFQKRQDFHIHVKQTSPAS